MDRTTSSAHALTHDVAYEGLLVGRRRALHEAVGQLLERQFADRLDEIVERLAHHYSRTERDGKAVEYPSRSAEKAVQSYAHAEAAPPSPRGGPPPRRAASRRGAGAARARPGGAPGHLLVLPEPSRGLPRPAVPATGRGSSRSATQGSQASTTSGSDRSLPRPAATPARRASLMRAIEEAGRAGDAHDDRQGPHRAGLGGLLHWAVRGGGRAWAGSRCGPRADRRVVVA